MISVFDPGNAVVVRAALTAAEIGGIRAREEHIRRTGAPPQLSEEFQRKVASWVEGYQLAKVRASAACCSRLHCCLPGCCTGLSIHVLSNTAMPDVSSPSAVSTATRMSVTHARQISKKSTSGREKSETQTMSLKKRTSSNRPSAIRTQLYCTTNPVRSLS